LEIEMMHLPATRSRREKKSGLELREGQGHRRGDAFASETQNEEGYSRHELSVDLQ
jgi:hypothetical protein